MKRFKLICICTALMSMLAFSANAEELSKAERFAVGAGFISAEDYSSEAEVTRGEFASILVNALNLDDDNIDYKNWQQSVAGGDTTSVEMEVSAPVFDDVDASHPYYYEIEIAKQNGLMVGISDTSFAPEYSITVREAAKVMLDIMGYGVKAEWDGGYPAGYTSTAQSTGLLSGLGSSVTDAATKADIAKMLYNALDIRLLEIYDFASTNYRLSEETFMTGILEMGKVKGNITDNGYTTVTGASKIALSEITVGSVTAVLPSELASAKDMLGRRVEMYYRTDEYDDSTAVYIEVVDDNDAISFDIDDFISYSNDRIVYEDANGRTKTVNLAKNAELILNNEIVSAFNTNTFDYADGDVTILKDENGDYSVIIANKYEYVLVGTIERANEYLYNKLQGTDINNKYDFSGMDIEKERIDIRDADGNAASFESINTNDVLSIRKSDNYMSVVITKDIVSGFMLAGSNVDEEESIITGDLGEYNISETYNSLTNNEKLTIGKVYDLYLNVFGEVVWVTAGGESGTDEKIGILTAAKYYKEEEEHLSRFVRIYTSDGKLVRYYAPEKITVNGSRKKYEDIYGVLQYAEGEAILYKLREDGLISEITLATNYGQNKTTGSNNSDWYRIAPYGEYVYGTQGDDFSKLFYHNNATMIYTVPNDAALYDDEDNFSLNTTTFNDNEEIKLEAYARERNSIVADAIVLRREASEVTDGGKIEEAAAFLVQKIIDTVNEDNEPIRLFKGYTMKIGRPAEYKELVVSTDAIIIGFGSPGTKLEAAEGMTESQIAALGPLSYEDISAGDIISYSLNINDEIEVIRMAYDYSENKPFNGGRGTDVYATGADRNGSATNSTWVGGAVAVVGDGLRIATVGNPAAVNYNDFESVKNNTKSFRLTNSNAILIAETNGKSFEVRNGSLSDIVTYDETRDFDNVVVLTYWSSGHYGTVVYKEN